jgi:hypothetical protein
MFPQEIGLPGNRGRTNCPVNRETLFIGEPNSASPLNQGRGSPWAFHTDRSWNFYHAKRVWRPAVCGHFQASTTMEPVDVGTALGALLGLVAAQMANRRHTARAIWLGAALLVGTAFLWRPDASAALRAGTTGLVMGIVALMVKLDRQRG